MTRTGTLVAVRIGVLGTVDGPSGLSGVRLRGLLARLALDAGRPVSTAALVDGLWETPPENAANALQALVSRLRRSLGELVVTEPGGYRLAVEPRSVDAVAFDALVTEARSAGPAQAHGLLGDALALWRGPALADVVELPFARPAAARLDGRRADAVDERARLALRLGLAPDVDALAAQLAAAPLRETTAALLGRALHAAGRQADALATLDRTIALLAEELGVDPGLELGEARMAVLRPALAAPRTAGLSSFVGRAADVERIRTLLRTARLVTLTGPGGAGKTRLAREATFVPEVRPATSWTAAPHHDASHARPHTPAAIGAPVVPAPFTPAAAPSAVVAELAALTDATQLPPAVLAAVGEPELHLGLAEAPDPMTRLLAALAHRDTILVLDNCEHLVADVAELAEALLTGCPRLRVLATSREPLGVPGEVLHPVDALAEPDAVRLFADRAAAVRPGFALDAATRPVVTEICRRLDGQPLPIELAAARLRTLSPQEIAARLDDRFRLLTTGVRTALPRHQTLRAVVDWSWDLLTDSERAVARRLGAFAGGATLAAAERVCGPDAWEALTSLVDKSLVVAVPHADGPTRYRMLETIRAYAGEKLDAAGERPAAEAAHAAFVLDLVEEAEPHIRRREQLQWLARLRAEADEIDLALRRTTTSDGPVAYRIVVAMMWSWLIRGRLEEGKRWLAALPPPSDDVDAHIRVLAMTYQAMSAIGSGDIASGRVRAEAAIAALAALPRPWHPVLELVEPITVAFAEQDEGPLRTLAETADDPWTRALALQTRAVRAENYGDLAVQRELLRATHASFAALGERFGLGMVLYSLGELENLAGEYDAAASAFDEAIALTAELGNDEDLHQFIAGRAMVDARRGDYRAARALLARAAEPRRRDGSLAAAKAQVERMAGDLETARAHLAVVDAAIAADPLTYGIPQRQAYLALLRAQVELAAGDPATARALLRPAAELALTSRDGPVVGMVAEVAAQLAHAEGDASAVVDLLATAVARRGTLDYGAPEVGALLTALGPHADAQIVAAAPQADAATLTGFLARDPVG
jgi:predicted ATPase/DNA-binding SARP family transcriptional activator